VADGDGDLVIKKMFAAAPLISPKSLTMLKTFYRRDLAVEIFYKENCILFLRNQMNQLKELFSTQK